MRPAPKKSLGQNFLRDGHARARVVSACGFGAQDIVLEIGPGQGAMTPLIASLVKKVYAVELDRDLLPVLAGKFRDIPAITVIHADILSFDLSSIPESRSQKIKVFGNIPYYITSPIIERLFGFREQVERIFLTVQKEFGRRITAVPGSKEYGAFTCYVRYYAEPKVLFDISRRSFFPVPKVDSSLISLALREQPPVEADEKTLFRLIRTAFQQRRKTLRNSLQGMAGEEALNEFFSRRHIDPKIRPEMLSLEDFGQLAGLVTAKVDH